MPSLFHEWVEWWVSPYLNRFIQPDTIIPNPANPQSWNRFSYVGNNPIRFRDPTGHMQESDGLTNKGSNCHGIFAKYCKNGKPKSRAELIAMRQPKRNPGPALLTAFPVGPGCQVVVPACGIAETNNLSYLIGLGSTIEVTAASMGLSTYVKDGQLIVKGARDLRQIVGLNPYTNHISLTNASSLSAGYYSGMMSSARSPWTWSSIGISAGADTLEFANGDYTPSEYSAALTVDVGTGLLSAAFGGAVAGGTIGFLGGFTAGLGMGAVPGFIAGALLGAAAGMGSYYLMNIYKGEMINFMAPGIEVAQLAQAQVYRTPWVGTVGYP